MATQILQSKLFLAAEQNEARRLHDLIDAELGEEIFALSLFEAPHDPNIWRVELYIERSQIAEYSDRVKSCLGGDFFGLELGVEDIEDQDWVTQSLEGLPPVRAGRFLVHGDHDRDKLKIGDIGIEINAGQAFGTGHHGTTAGCLDMLEWVLKRSEPRIAHDVGTGSGVLAIALAKAAHIPILASDIDPVATKTAKANVVLNGVASEVTCFTSTGFNHNLFRNTGPVPLIIANILAKPLASLAPDMERYLETGGRLILSGLLPHQRARILATYNAHGLYHEKSHERDGWLTLVLRG